MREIRDRRGALVARMIEAADAWTGDFRFFSDANEFVQVGTWNYAKGKVLARHKHNTVRRESDVTQEVIFVRSGALRAEIYSDEKELIETLTVSAGDVLVLLRGGHGYAVEQDGTQVLEVKNGPYPGAEADRQRY